jgi:hypothetical protein
LTGSTTEVDDRVDAYGDVVAGDAVLGGTLRVVICRLTSPAGDAGTMSQPRAAAALHPAEEEDHPPVLLDDAPPGGVMRLMMPIATIAITMAVCRGVHAGPGARMGGGLGVASVDSADAGLPPSLSHTAYASQPVAVVASCGSVRPRGCRVRV